MAQHRDSAVDSVPATKRLMPRPGVHERRLRRFVGEGFIVRRAGTDY